MVYILLTVVVTVVFASVLFVLKELQSARAELADLRRRLDESERVTKQHLERSLSTGREQEAELNTLWAELESLRSSIAALGTGLSVESWRRVLRERAPSLDHIRGLLQRVASLDDQLSEQLKANLPCYLFNDEPLTGLLDFVRTPFDRINWLDALILPANFRTTNNSELESALVEVAEALGFEVISPQIGTMYDPELHEPVEQRNAPKARGTILAVRATGYQKSGKVLLKSKVIICA